MPRRSFAASAREIFLNEGSMRLVQHAGVRHRPLQSRRGAGALYFFPLGHEGAERRNGAGGHLVRRRVLLRSSTRASRRSTAAIFYTAPCLLSPDRRLASHVIRAALALPFIRCCPSH